MYIGSFTIFKNQHHLTEEKFPHRSCSLIIPTAFITHDYITKKNEKNDKRKLTHKSVDICLSIQYFKRLLILYFQTTSLSYFKNFNIFRCFLMCVKEKERKKKRERGRKNICPSSSSDFTLAAKLHLRNRMARLFLN